MVLAPRFGGDLLDINSPTPVPVAERFDEGPYFNRVCVVICRKLSGKLRR
jgi:hypothetical protein